MIEDGAIRRRMAPGVTTPEIEALDRRGPRCRCLGTKVMGAGGGGCVLIVLPPEGAPGVDALLADEAVHAIPVRLAGSGLRLWYENEEPMPAS